ncbi:MAG TPA: hypothetical protein ENN22_03510, partial [bacterium]|nr:hypothetical protein [bacterium]
MQSVQIRQILFLLFLLIAFFIVFGFLIYYSTLEAAESAPGFFGKKKLIHYQSDHITIDTDEVIEADILLERSEISISGKIFGDIIALETDVELNANAEIYGHVICYNGILDITDEARVAGDVIIIDSLQILITGGRNLVGYGFQLNIFQSDSTISKEQNLSGDILILNQDLVIEGRIDGDVYNILGKTIIKSSGAIDGHAICYLGQLILDKQALVTGRVWGGGADSRTAQDKQLQQRDERYRKKIERKYLKNRRKKGDDIVRFWGDVTIEPDEMIRGSVVALRGNVHIKGEIDGDIVAIFGDIELDSLAQVDGDVVSVGGKIYRQAGVTISGDMVQTSFTGVKVDSDDQHVSVGFGGVRVGPQTDDNWEQKRRPTRQHRISDWDDDSFVFRYNRVEGLFLGLNLPRHRHKNEYVIFNVYGHIGYGFSAKRACYQIGVERVIFGKYGPIIGIETHDITATEDEWIMPTFENSLAAILIREDFHDFYRKFGYSAYLNHFVSELLMISAQYHQTAHRNISKQTNWAIFGGDKKFRHNPAIDEIDFKSVVGKIVFDTRDSYKYPNKGWLFTASGEFVDKKFNDNGVDFDRIIVDLRRYQPIGFGENFDFRLRAGSSRGAVPVHLKFDLGGFSTLRGYQFKEFSDHNRMLLGNLEYRLYGRHNPLNSVIGITDINLILFADAGYVWTVSDSLKAHEGFDEVDWGDLKTSVGIALSNDRGNV